LERQPALRGIRDFLEIGEKMGKEVYEKLAEKILCKGSKIVPELFAMITDEKEAGLLVQLPGSIAELKARLGWEEKEIESRLNQLFKKGLVFKSKKPEGIKYRLCRDLGQFHDASILWSGATQEFYDLWQKYMEEEWPAYTVFVEKFLPKPFTRVIPIEKTVPARNQILSSDSVQEIIDKTSRVALTKCTCRLIAHKCDKPVEVCLQVGKAADYTLERGTGREISKDDARRILRQAEEAGLIHVTVNKSSEFTYICNCCGDCCQVLPLLIKEGRKLCDPSRFQASVKKEDCNGCEICLERCWFKAIRMIPEGGNSIAVINSEKCMGCGLCALKCPTEAIQLIQVREKEFIPA